MKKIFIIVLFNLGSLLSARAGYIAESLGQTALGSYSGSTQVEPINIIKDGEGVSSALLVLWRPDPNGPLLQLTGSLSILDELLRKEFQNAAAKRSTTSVRNTIGGTLLLYGKRHDYFVLRGRVRDGYIKVLKESVDALKFEKLLPYLQDVSEKISPSDWTMGFTSVTSRGAIERWTVSGTLEPFSIRKEEREILAPDGSLPKVHYVPDPYLEE